MKNNRLRSGLWEWNNNKKKPKLLPVVVSVSVSPLLANIGQPLPATHGKDKDRKRGFIMKIEAGMRMTEKMLGFPLEWV
jgi:hypothetical protein